MCVKGFIRMRFRCWLSLNNIICWVMANVKLPPPNGYLWCSDDVIVEGKFWRVVCDKMCL